MSVSKYKSYKVFFDGLALLHTVANQETLFLAYLLAEMDEENIVHMTAYQKKEIMREIGSKTKSPLTMANQHLFSLCKKGLLTTIGGGSYMVNPKFASTLHDHKYKIDSKSVLYARMVCKKNSEMKIEVGVEDES